MSNPKKLVLLCLILICSGSDLLIAQTVQWASEVVRYSSQYDDKQYSAEQILGRPSVLPNYGSSPVAWAPTKEDNRVNDWVWVQFATPMKAQQVAIAENLNPGAIYRIYLIDHRNRKYEVYKNKEPRGVLDPSRMFRVHFEMTDYLVHGVRLEIATGAVPGMNQIDAIGISDSKEPIEAKINLIDYDQYEGEPENLGPNVNSRYEDRYPIISPDGETLYFARKFQPDESGEHLSDDIFVSRLDANGNWTPAEKLGKPLNNKFHNFVSAVSTDGSTLILANEYNRFGSEGVSIAEWNERKDEWSKPDALRIRSMYNKNEFTCYHMNTDGDVIVMAIEQDDSYGDMDIYASFKEDEDGRKWTDPLNLGRVINTAGIEGSAFLAADGRTLYFSSDGHAGYGGTDMFMSKRLDDTWTNWSEPVNLGPKINSRQMEYNYTIPASGDYAYFSSSNGQFGAADLFRIPLPKEVQPEPVALLKGKFIDAITKEPLDVEIKYKPKSALPEEKEKEKTYKVKGKYGLVLPRREEFEVVAEKPGYFPSSTPNVDEPVMDEELYMDYDETDEQERIKREIKEEIYTDLSQKLEKQKASLEADPKGPELTRQELQRELDLQLQEQIEKKAGPFLSRSEQEELKLELEEDLDKTIEEDVLNEPKYVELEQDVEMIPIKKGQVIRINNIFFQANKSHLLPESHAELDRIVTFLEDNPGIAVEVGGHTNGLPSHEFCDELSDARAKRVHEYLVENGIDPSRLTYKGYGKNQPIADNRTLAGRKKNQRVELKIIRVR